MITQSQIRYLHSEYVRLTGLDIRLTMPRIFQWESWAANGFNQAHLEMVVKHLKRRIPDAQRQARAFRFEWFIGRPETFGEDLAEAKALHRAPSTNTDRESVLRVTGRPTATKDNVRSAADILAGENALRELLKVRDSL